MCSNGFLKDLRGLVAPASASSAGQSSDSVSSQQAKTEVQTAEELWKEGVTLLRDFADVSLSLVYWYEALLFILHVSHHRQSATGVDAVMRTQRFDKFIRYGFSRLSSIRDAVAHSRNHRGNAVTSVCSLDRMDVLHRALKVGFELRQGVQGIFSRCILHAATHQTGNALDRAMLKRCKIKLPAEWWYGLA